MSRSRKDAKGGHRGKGSGYEHWTSRWAPGGSEPGRWTKTVTHRRERRVGKSTLSDVLHVRRAIREEPTQ